MPERWGDRDVSEDTGLIVDRLDDLIAVLERIATALEKPTPEVKQRIAYAESVQWLREHGGTTVRPDVAPRFMPKAPIDPDRPR